MLLVAVPEAFPGNCRAVVEVAAGGGVICASEFLLKVTENPVQEGAIESEDEYLTLTEILAQVQHLKGIGCWDLRHGNLSAGIERGYAVGCAFFSL